jgi:hypothetical protein
MKDITILKRRILHNLKEVDKYIKYNILITVYMLAIFPKSRSRFDPYNNNLCLYLNKKYYPVLYYDKNVKYSIGLENKNTHSLYGPIDLDVDENDFKRRMKLLIFN